MPPVSASRSPHDDDAPDSHAGAPHAGDPETLDRYAAAGGMAPDRIRRILADLVPSLEALHRAGRAHGDIAPSTIGLDASGRARLLTPPLAPAANAEDAPRRDGYAAFEQYTDDPDTPCGPWTDIYALSATACALLTGLAPPAALARCVRDDYVPLTQRRGQDEQALCVVLDNGLALDAYARPQTIDEFARALRLDITPAAGKPPVAEAPPAQRQGMLEDADGLEATSAWISAQATHEGNQASTEPQGDSAGTEPGYASHDAGQTAPHPASEVTLYREGQLAEAQPGKGRQPRQEPDRDQAAVDYEAAVAAMHTRKDPEPSQAQRTQVPPAGKTPHRRRHQQKQRAPRLMILAVIVMVGVALYVWLRPQPTPRRSVVASTSSPSSGAARPPASNAGTGTSSAGTPTNASNGSNGSNASSSSNASNTSSTSNGVTSATQNNATGNAVSGGSVSNNATGGTPSTAPNNASAAPDATASQPPGNSMSSGAMAMNPGMSATAGATPPNATSSASPSTGSASPATTTPATGEQGIAAQKLPNPTITTVDLGKSGVSTPSAGKSPAGPTAAPADSSAKPRTASKAPVAVAIAVRPWGEILVNGKSRGVSPPLNSLTLPPGTYDITIRNNAGPDVHQSLTVAAGKSAAISHTFR